MSPSGSAILLSIWFVLLSLMIPLNVDLSIMLSLLYVVAISTGYALTVSTDVAVKTKLVSNIKTLKTSSSISFPILISGRELTAKPPNRYSKRFKTYELKTTES